MAALMGFVSVLLLVKKSGISLPRSLGGAAAQGHAGFVV